MWKEFLYLSRNVLVHKANVLQKWKHLIQKNIECLMISELHSRYLTGRKTRAGTHCATRELTVWSE